MSKRKAVKSLEHEKEHHLLSHDSANAKVEEETLPRPAGPPTFQQAILGMGQVYGNRYMSSLIENGGVIDKHTRDRIEAQRGSGSPLDDGLRMAMEQSFDRDLGDVRLHTGSEAAGLASELDAGAFTTGRDIFFANNAFQPGTDNGIRVLRHELTHVVQQVKGTSVEASRLTGPGDLSEQEASRAETSDMGYLAAELSPLTVARIKPGVISVDVEGGGGTRHTSSSDVPGSGGRGRCGRSGPAAKGVVSMDEPSYGASCANRDQGEADPEAQRRQAAIARWDAGVVGAAQAANRLIAGGSIDSTKATQAMAQLGSALTSIGSISAGYADRPEVQASMQSDLNLIMAVKNGLASYAGVQVPEQELISNLANGLGQISSRSSQF